SLPSVKSLLASLGIDLTALLDQLTQGNLTKLAGVVTSTTTGAVATANAAVDSAQTALTGAGQTPAQSMAAAQSELTAAQADATQKNSDFTSAWNAAFAALGAPAQAAVTTALATAGVSPPPPTADQFDTMVNSVNPTAV